MAAFRALALPGRFRRTAAMWFSSVTLRVSKFGIVVLRYIPVLS